MTKEQLEFTAKEKADELCAKEMGRFGFIDDIEKDMTILKAFWAGRFIERGQGIDAEIICETEEREHCNKDYFLKAQSIDTLFDDFEAFVKEVIETKKRGGYGEIYVRVRPEISTTVQYGHIIYGLYTRLIFTRAWGA